MYIIDKSVSGVGQKSFAPPSIRPCIYNIIYYRWIKDFFLSPQCWDLDCIHLNRSGCDRPRRKQIQPFLIFLRYAGFFWGGYIYSNKQTSVAAQIWSFDSFPMTVNLTQEAASILHTYIYLSQVNSKYPGIFSKSHKNVFCCLTK